MTIRSVSFSRGRFLCDRTVSFLEKDLRKALIKKDHDVHDLALSYDVCLFQR